MKCKSTLWIFVFILLVSSTAGYQMETTLESGNITMSANNEADEKPAEKYESKANTAINHFYEKILKITPDTFHTETAKKIAESRYDYTKDFVKRFLKEWEGEL